MNTLPIARLLAVAALLATTAHARAADFAFDGTIVMNNDLVNVDFTIAGSGAVQLWTDSFRSGLNFDPQLTLWQQVGSDYRLIANNDDDTSLAASQTGYDAGIATTLAAGTYKLTLSAASYQAAGTLLSQGFQFDPFFLPAITPTPIATWNQPSYDPNANDQKGGFWSVHLSGTSLVSAAVSPVPEPATLLLMVGGLAAIVRKSRSAHI